MTTSIVTGRDSTDKGQDCPIALSSVKNSNCTAFTVCFELSHQREGAFASSVPRGPLEQQAVLVWIYISPQCGAWTAVCDDACDDAIEL